MFGIDTAVLVGIGVVSAWKLLKWWRPSWAKKLEVLRPIARQAFDALEVIGAMLHLTGKEKYAGYCDKVRQSVAAAGIPMTDADWNRAEAELKAWADQWAKDRAWVELRLKQLSLPKPTLPR